MIKFLNILTMGNIGTLRKSMILEFLRSVLQGQPFIIILMVVLELLRPVFEVDENLNYGRLWGMTGWLAVSLVLLFFIGRATYREESAVAFNIGAEGRLSLGAHLKNLSMGFFKGHDPGDITALMLQDYANVETMLSHMLMDALGALFTPVVFLLFLLPVHWQMTLVTLAPIPLSLSAAVISRSIVTRNGMKHIKVKNEASARMLEYLEGIKSVKAFNLQGEKFNRLKDTFLRLKKESIRLEASGGPLVILAIWILNAGIALIMLVGTRLLISGSISVPLLLFFVIVGTRMYDPVSKFLISFVELSYFAISAKRIGDILDEQALPEPTVPKNTEKCDIEFRDVGFRYHDTNVLDNVNFVAKEGTMTALVGPSGSGKTTITRLIARFWDVNNGEIRIGGIPLKEQKNDDLMAKLSMVFQDVYLFNDTILNNIRVGRQNASMEEVKAAAEKARCLEFIDSLPEGFETEVGEGGATLSGGEKQRLSIARAILKDAPVVLLDEATASLDPENELYIQEAIAELVKGRTLIVIAHRLSTVTQADQILVLDKGRIVEQGAHNELIALEKGLYRNMWEEQKRAHVWKIASGESASDLNFASR